MGWSRTVLVVLRQKIISQISPRRGRTWGATWVMAFIAWASLHVTPSLGVARAPKGSQSSRAGCALSLQVR